VRALSVVGTETAAQTGTHIKPARCVE